MLRGSLMANMMSKEDINSVIKHWISRGKSIFDDNKHLLADQDVHNELRLNLNLNIMLEAVQSILESIIADLSEVDVEACNANKILEHVGDMATEGFRLTKSTDWVDYIPTNGYSSPEYKKNRGGTK